MGRPEPMIKFSSEAVTENSSGEIIGALGQRADDIGKIIEVIDDLAEQTKAAL